METYMLIISIILLVIILAVLFMRKGSSFTTDSLKRELENIFKEELQETRRENRDLNTENRRELNTIFKDHQDTLLKRITELNKQQQDNLDLFSKNLNQNLRQRFDELSKQHNEFNKQSKDSIKDISESIEKSLKAIREDNSTQLNEMRKTVDEKLQSTLEKRLGESFKLVSERLELVHRGLGKMQELASDVGDLQKVLNNVKTRGILGEYQLGNILEQILSPEQYSQNVATKKGSQANVEFAINLPGKVDDNAVWLPIDSKFPIENYQLLIDAYDMGDKSKIELSQKNLLKSIELFAKTISEKYIDPPQTTDFAIMFLPVESLYAEVLKHPGTFEKLQREYHITVTGPTTLSALLNSLQMGFRTLAVQKRSSEVWKVLSGVKTEFSKFSDHLSKVHKQINTASGSLDILINTRTNAMERKLKSVETMDNTIEPPESFELPLSSDMNDES
ncbi:MAG: DNA recombination protein RmuC [Lentimicrobiaceae bacterium]|jgi:DNA recombination protein RmuC|nr:DNA recombination protein RmuC [Lentimicrobiaceae bacterium]MDG1902561.1 DNA recombination protein RmuC [Bacteroidales bacterium]MDG2080421.1 DNA recombination protein RmuC [Bacteroidales bacterium]